MHSRYNTSNDENQETLKNKLGIKDQKMLDDTETLLLSDAYETFFKHLQTEKLKFDVKLIFEINKYFLNTLYTWAGKKIKTETRNNKKFLLPYRAN